MARRTLHVVMAIMLIFFVASLTDTAIRRNEPCPLCGARTVCIGEMRNRTVNRRLVSVSRIIHCGTCDYEVVTP